MCTLRGSLRTAGDSIVDLSNLFRFWIQYVKRLEQTAKYSQNRLINKMHLQPSNMAAPPPLKNVTREKEASCMGLGPVRRTYHPGEEFAAWCLSPAPSPPPTPHHLRSGSLHKRKGAAGMPPWAFQHRPLFRPSLRRFPLALTPGAGRGQPQSQYPASWPRLKTGVITASEWDAK